ncbi:MAG: prephenate dehydratase [Elusimicrobia bacterium RIFCSPLOWO2_01_FULL_59_12]|nr:MAG: prephenate dehydratase [Elusimicrobia bacterium RIFCSPLOWO2_01_FULL_59_12]
MASLKKLRDHIDRLDQSLLRFLNQRGRLVETIGQLKQKNGRSVFVPSREKSLLQRLKRLNRGPLSSQAVQDVFNEIVHACRSLQKKLRISFLGPEATFTHQAALKSFGHQAALVSAHSIADVFSEVEKGRADYGVVPIENSTEGVVNHTLDMFIESNLSICAEMELPIWHYLLGREAEYRRKGGVRALFSHYQALAQCRQWVEAHLPELRIVETASTSEAARMAARTPHAVAIASRLAADLYGLDVLASRIEDATHNYTRFLVIGSAEPRRTGRDKTSIMFSVKDRVGALHDILVPFKKHHLNMTKIESRPTRQRAWEYIFFVDFLGHRSDARVQKALQGLERSCAFLKILGSYPRTE